jgi:hypothetical protein
MLWGILESRSFDGVFDGLLGHRQNGHRQKGGFNAKEGFPLTDLQVKNAKPQTKDYKLSDGGGLYLLITSSGGKLWRFDYRFSGKRLTLFLN